MIGQSVHEESAATSFSEIVCTDGGGDAELGLWRKVLLTLETRIVLPPGIAYLRGPPYRGFSGGRWRIALLEQRLPFAQT